MTKGKTASGLSPATLRTAVARANALPEVVEIVDMALTAVEACKRTRQDIATTNEYAIPAVEGVIKAGEMLAALERGKTGPKLPDTMSANSPYRRAVVDSGLDERTAQRWQAAAGVSSMLESYLSDVAEAEEIATWTGLLAYVKMGGLKSTTGVEWYTPARYIKAAREVMGSIDLDPASSELANETVGADTYFSKDDDPDGLSQDWFGNIWLNPPYGKGSGLFTSKLVEEHAAGRVTAGVLLLNAYGFDASWFQPLWDWPICFTDHRIEFYSPLRASGGPANGNIFAYLGDDPAAFALRFAEFGAVVRRWP